MTTLKAIIARMCKPVPAKSLASIVIENSKMWDEIAERNGMKGVPHFVVTANGQAFRPL